MIDGWLGPMPHPQKWVFIVGCYNSGTTLLHDMLAIHPQIGSMDREGQYYTDQLPMPRRHGFPRLWALQPDMFYLKEGDGRHINVARLKRQWGAHFDDCTRRVLLEKSPTNAARTRWLQEHFEDAHFIGIIRNGYAVAEGIHRKEGHPLDVTAVQWALSNEIMLRDFEVLREKQLIRYETLTGFFEEVLREILEFVGLKPIGSNVADRTWRIHEQVSPIRNMNQRSLEALGDKERKVIDAAAGHMLEYLGYM